MCHRGLPNQCLGRFLETHFMCVLHRANSYYGRKIIKLLQKMIELRHLQTIRDKKNEEHGKTVVLLR